MTEKRLLDRPQHLCSDCPEAEARSTFQANEQESTKKLMYGRIRSSHEKDKSANSIYEVRDYDELTFPLFSTASASCLTLLLRVALHAHFVRGSPACRYVYM